MGLLEFRKSREDGKSFFVNISERPLLEVIEIMDQANSLRIRKHLRKHGTEVLVKTMYKTTSQKWTLSFGANGLPLSWISRFLAIFLELARPEKVRDVLESLTRKPFEKDSIL